MIANEIKRLAAVQSSDDPFLSVYLDTNRNDESQLARVRLFLKEETRRARESLGTANGHGPEIERGIHQIEQFVEHSLAPSTRGLAIFACPARDLFVTIELPVPVEPLLAIGSRPQLRPLTLLRQAHPLVVVAMVDGKSARLFELEFGQILHEIDLEHPDMPRKHEQGGWSQSNMQRHVQDHIDRHHRDVAEKLARMVDTGAYAGVVLSGQDRNLANFRDHLPKRVHEKVLGELHLDIHASGEQIAGASADLIRERGVADIGERLTLLEETAQKNGRGALGFASLVEAVNQRRLSDLFLGHTAHSMGWQCTQCRTLGQQVPLGCPACGSAVRTVDLVEEFIAAAESEDAGVHIVQSASLLDRYDGVGALLRF